jgi:hypothetical protein
MFHVVFAMTDCEKDEVDLIYEHCLLKITSCLKYEQLRRGYVRSETELMLNLRDKYQQGVAGFSDLMEETLKQSSLASTLRMVYNALNNNGPNHLIVNNSSRLSIQPDLEILRLIGKPVISGTFKTPFPTLRPYHGILLLFDADEILKRLLPDSSPLLIRFIQSGTTTSSFEQMQSILDCSLSQIYKLAAHLHYWGQARIIQSMKICFNLSAISSRNFYVISDDSQFAK